jgi:hypothetical protein
MSRGVFTSREVSLKFSYSFRDRAAILRLRGRGRMILADDYRMHCKRTITCTNIQRSNRALLCFAENHIGKLNLKLRYCGKLTFFG